MVFIFHKTFEIRGIQTKENVINSRETKSKSHTYNGTKNESFKIRKLISIEIECKLLVEMVRLDDKSDRLPLAREP